MDRSLLDLPDDALLAVLAYLGPLDLMTCRPVCRRLRDLSLHRSLWRDARLKIRGEALPIAALRLAPCLAELDVSQGMELAASALSDSACVVASLRLGDDGSGDGYYAREVLQRVANLGGLNKLVLDFSPFELNDSRPVYMKVDWNNPCNSWEMPNSLLELVYNLDIRELSLICAAPLIPTPFLVRAGGGARPCLTKLRYHGLDFHEVDYFLEYLLQTHASTLTYVYLPPRYLSLSTLQSMPKLQSVSLELWSISDEADDAGAIDGDAGEDDNAGDDFPVDDDPDHAAHDDPVGDDDGHNDPVGDDGGHDDPPEGDNAGHFDPVGDDGDEDPVEDDAGDDGPVGDVEFDDPGEDEAGDNYEDAGNDGPVEGDAPVVVPFLGLGPHDDVGVFPPGALEFLGLHPQLKFKALRGFIDHESILTVTESPFADVVQELVMIIDSDIAWDLLSSSLYRFSSLTTLSVNEIPSEDFLQAVTPASAPCLTMLKFDTNHHIHDVLHEPAIKDLLQRNEQLHLRLEHAGRRVPSGCDCRWCLHKAEGGWKYWNTFASHSWAAECCGTYCFQWP
ncbi:uncharacterized protein LOC117642628 [Thrips palmi]|uniref:Uncharacterized protein LOC117642628 n=1 Tax=Thrips palmi TaxID=161013 RepID=A0A6P8YB92_THRPL|nr:uncharacterized protein LOC117642628 [Thrips palmi]XP_034236876.1 uncharacterized protein LOC117642628 [Thrips palmi]XP_034236878.1 uncharacterized protein LOC117642628 [Thrips palmi]XP_034236879.1 uncharacterized protein LOC117642628 [Thrips palmi]XP_034236880.1 uncharacterized protein LOC117642628 [Thrips palmi]XP_034236881.1 uncharacterized protein LOC117642628 [Thrips palmi]XP_034236882.1 uncharacterized protein LOC117642628 [Thrips palmi]XP_034236884.1 uncharacterized protein LOC1176